MLAGTFRMWVSAEPETVWRVLQDGVENPQRYLPDVEASQVLERLAGGVVEELRIGSEFAPWRFDFFVFNRGVLREIKSHDNHDASVRGVFGSFAYESAVLREVTVRGVPYREKILISRANREIRRDLIGHPASEGRIIIRAVPLSTQNPMAPVDLQFAPVLTPNPSRSADTALWLEEMLFAIREEQRRLKAAAEEKKKRA